MITPIMVIANAKKYPAVGGYSIHFNNSYIIKEEECQYSCNDIRGKQMHVQNHSIVPL